MSGSFIAAAVMPSAISRIGFGRADEYAAGKRDGRLVAIAFGRGGKRDGCHGFTLAVDGFVASRELRESPVGNISWKAPG